IEFVCSCGKRLKASDDIAARDVVCLRCGSLLSIPPLDPIHLTAVRPAEWLLPKARGPIRIARLDGQAATRQPERDDADGIGDNGNRRSSQITPQSTPRVPSSAARAPQPLDAVTVHRKLAEYQRQRKRRRWMRRFGFAGSDDWHLATSWYACL